MTGEVPIAHRFDLSRVDERGHEERISVPAEALRALAAWYEIEDVEALTALLRISRLSVDEFALEGHLEADVVQSCVVTLEPVRAHIVKDFTRSYRIVPRTGTRRGDLEAPAADDDEEIETLTGTSLDLAAPVLEELSLALDPYPRKPDVAFDAPQQDAASGAGPFAVLGKLKAPAADPNKSKKPKKNR